VEVKTNKSWKGLAFLGGPGIGLAFPFHPAHFEASNIIKYNKNWCIVRYNGRERIEVVRDEIIFLS